MTDKIFTLPVKEQITATVSLRQLDQLPVVVVEHPKARAAVTLQGAHLLAWQPAGDQPVIWLSGNTPFKEGVAIRGGVPVCWPWFGPAAQPPHGFARLLPWEFTAHEENEDGVKLTFTLTDSDATRQHWPHAFKLIARFTLGEECKFELESQGDFEARSALHTYFEVGDIATISIRGLGSHYIDKVLDGITAEHSGDLVFTGRTDRIYTQPESHSVITDATLKRTIEVEHHNNHDVVAWNPDAELSRNMADMPDDGYKTMVCVETAYVTEPVISKAGAPAKMAMVIRSRKLRG